MSKLKKVLLMCTAYALVAALAIGGTLAYLTDRDSEVNTFTVGDVAIDLTEEFEQGAELIPGVKIDKNAEITNVGKNDAWVWLSVLLPKELGPYTAPDSLSASNNVVHWNYPAANADNITVQFESVPVSLDPDGDGVESDYYRTSLLYNKVLAPEAATGIMLSTVYMDTHIDIAPNGDWYWVKDGGEVIKLNWNSETSGLPKLYVSAYAIQADQFETVAEAYAAYNKQWGENGTEYNDNSTFVENEAELLTALTNGGEITITKSIMIQQSIDANKDAILSSVGSSVLSVADNATINVVDGAKLELTNMAVSGLADGVNENYRFENGKFVVANAEARREVAVFTVKDGATLNLGKGTVIENIIGKKDGETVVSATRGSHVVLDGVTVKNCAGKRGTVVNANNSTVVIKDGTVISNNASYDNANHGLIYAVNGSTLTIEGGLIADNLYSGNGLISAYDSNIVMNDGIISGNSPYKMENSYVDSTSTANGRYGLIYIHQNSSFTMNGGQIINNNLALDGVNVVGTIDAYKATSSIILNAGQVTGNMDKRTNGTEFKSVAYVSQGSTIVISKNVQVDADAMNIDENKYYAGGKVQVLYPISEYIA